MWIILFPLCLTTHPEVCPHQERGGPLIDIIVTCCTCAENQVAVSPLDIWASSCRLQTFTFLRSWVRSYPPLPSAVLQSPQPNETSQNLPEHARPQPAPPVSLGVLGWPARFGDNTAMVVSWVVGVKKPFGHPVSDAFRLLLPQLPLNGTPSLQDTGQTLCLCKVDMSFWMYVGLAGPFCICVVLSITRGVLEGAEMLISLPFVVVIYRLCMPTPSGASKFLPTRFGISR